MGALDEHVADQIAAVEETLTHVDEIFGNLNSVDYDDVIKDMTPLERAKYDLTNIYAINSLFFMYMRSFGENPQIGTLKDELDRIKQQMMRVSEIANKSKMPRLNKDAAQRMIKHELWEPNTNQASIASLSKEQTGLSEENWEEEEEPMETDANKSRKRKREPEDCEEELNVQNNSTPSRESSSDYVSEDDDANETDSSSEDGDLSDNPEDD